MNLDDITNFLAAVFSSDKSRMEEAKVKKNSNADNKQGFEFLGFLGFEKFKNQSESSEGKSIDAEVQVTDGQNSTSNFGQIETDGVSANEQTSFILKNIVSVNESNLNIPPVILETKINTTSNDESNQTESTSEVDSEPEASESEEVQSNNEPVVPPYSEPETTPPNSDPIQENLNQGIEHNCDEFSEAELFLAVSEIYYFLYETEDISEALAELDGDMCALYHQIEPLAEAAGYYE